MSFVTQNNGKINCSEVMPELEKYRNDEKGKNYEDRTTKSKIFNRFSGTYFSPTFIKGFTECPARTFISNCLPRKSSPVANFGSCTHKAFEEIVKNKCWNNQNQINEIVENITTDFGISNTDKNTLTNKYIPNFINGVDYLDNGKPFPWDECKCFPETFYSADLNIFDIDLGSCYTLMDRIDIRDEGIFVIDYKTGRAPYNSVVKANFVNDYLNQMICYYWMIKKQFGIAPRVFAYLPDNNSYIEFPVSSLKNQSMFVETILNYYKDIKEQRENCEFEERINKWCKYCPIAKVCHKYNNVTGDSKISFDLNKI